MIRPFTFIALLLAAASGLYLYQTKHRAELLDAKVAQTLHQVAAARERIGILSAEWAWLNEPERLGQLVAAQHLDLQPLGPSHYATAAELAARVPPAQPVVLASVPAEDTPAAVTPLQAVPPPTAESTPVQASAPAVAVVPKAIPVAATTHPPASRSAAAATVAPKPALAARAPSSAGPMPVPVAAAPARSPVFAPAILSGVAASIPRAGVAAAQPMVTRTAMVAAQPPVPAVASALGGFGRTPLAPPVPLNGN